MPSLRGKLCRCALLLGALLPGGHAAPAPHRFFKITVVDRDTARPVSGVRLETVNHIVHLSDRNGVVAFYEPGLMGQRVFFFVSRQGYEHEPDGFGFRGRALDVTEGGSATLQVRRTGGPLGPDVESDEDSELLRGTVPDASQRFLVTVVDQATSRGVPLVELRTRTKSWFTDSAGHIALYDRSLLGQQVRFEVFSHGYRHDGPLTLTVTPGGRATVRLHRDNIAERLYRVTGQGIYRDSVLMNLPTPIQAPVLNGQVMGQDSVLTTVYRGQIFWIWGDTNRPAYPLGNFRAAGARSDLPGRGGLDPAVGVDLRYMTGMDGFAREMAPDRTVPGPGVTWLGSLVAVPDRSGKDVLFATYGKYGQDFRRYEHGVVRFRDDTEVFEKVLPFRQDEPVVPHGHPLRLSHHGREYLYFYNPVRVPATAEALADPAAYEAFTPFKQGSMTELERDPDGRLRYGWKPRTPPLSEAHVKSGLVSPEEALFGHVTDIETGETLTIHDNSTTAWSPYRGRFIGILLQAYGRPSFLGELWYAEADTPMGPWVYARKILTHNEYTFYNPRHHPFFDQEGGRFIYFEGTYTQAFSGTRVATPRYDYNQIMYRLDLADPRLVLPVPVYDIAEEGVFYAPDRPAPGTVPVFWTDCGAGPRLVVGGGADLAPRFYALPGDLTTLPPATEPLHEYVDQATGRRLYRVGAAADLPGLVRTPRPLVHVWRNPVRVTVPVADHRPGPSPPPVACTDDLRRLAEGAAGCACRSAPAPLTPQAPLMLLAGVLVLMARIHAARRGLRSGGGACGKQPRC